MRESVRGVASRIKGRGAILRSLRQLIVRVDRFGVLRARTDEERRWAITIGDHLQRAHTAGTACAAAARSLHAADARVNRSAKRLPASPPGAGA